MNRLPDITGKKFGDWEVIGFDGMRQYGKKTRVPMWHCRCSCGLHRLVEAKRLRNGSSTGCGHNQKTRERHGMTRTPTYISWASMKARTGHKSSDSNKNIYYSHTSMTERWNLFENFLEDMGVRPDGKTLDRLDPTRGYYKENCRWATAKEQNAPEHKRPRGTVMSVQADRWIELYVLSGLLDKSIRKKLSRFNIPDKKIVLSFAKQKYGSQFDVLLAKNYLLEER